MPAASDCRDAAAAPLRVVLCMVLAACAPLLAACAMASADSEPVAAAADAFLADQRAGAWLAAFGRLHAGMQQRCVSGEHLRAIVERSGSRPVRWMLRPPQVRRYTALVTGDVERADGATSAIALSFDRVEAGWAITAWSSANRELCP